MRQALLYLPNLPAPDAPDGDGPEDNVQVRSWPAAPPAYGDAQRVPHWEIGAELGLLDLERGAKLSGSMFPLYRGIGARLIRALSAFALDSHADDFEEVRPPTMVLTETMVSTGHLPKFEEEAYHLERDDLWAIPTAEVPLTSMWRGDILEESILPLRLTAATACFRREAGAAGRDTRGLLRVHEFDKVELFAYTTPEQAPATLDEIVARAERLLQDLGLQYRVLDLCTGDMGNSAAAYLRPRGLLPGGRHVARGLVGQLVQRLPGPAGQHPVPARGRWCPGPRPHPQRLGPGLGPDLGRVGGDRPAARRLRGAARGAGPLPPGPDGHSGRRLTRRTRRQVRGASNR